MSMAAAFLILAQAATGQPAVAPQAGARMQTASTSQANASARILRPVTLQLENGEITQQDDFLPPQRKRTANGEVWFEFS
ncbi:hypothetical protein P7228_04485 [Altererythrobacter arenosus]|uniref:Uncharacterized protein n=1 Tax=Altererythrobacter arenosus TaxID=3032592 RepID=A0ABY8FTI5_9SPHN|nr:hypothetical protein [Altererythrobacter sp. CAU 1644]WFL78327.1 hypothetical protein P7228_04485 [Altererythrobacter sp. CAU 1644]